MENNKNIIECKKGKKIKNLYVINKIKNNDILEIKLYTFPIIFI